MLKHSQWKIETILTIRSAKTLHPKVLPLADLLSTPEEMKSKGNTLLSPVQPLNEASMLSLSTLAVPQILYSTEPVLASGFDRLGAVNSVFRE